MNCVSVCCSVTFLITCVAVCREMCRDVDNELCLCVLQCHVPEHLCGCVCTSDV